MPTSDVYVHARFSDGTSRLVGRYRLVRPEGTASSFGEFAYVGSWLRDEGGRAFALDPAALPLGDKIQRFQKRLGLPGPLADTTPDRWGKRLIEASRPDHGAPMSVDDWLLATGDERVGCLAFSRTPKPPPPMSDFTGFEDLSAIAQGFEALIRGERASVLAERLYRAGRSIGGARPKAVVMHEGSLWIAKFQRKDDDYDQCSSEHATMRLAKLCGIDVAETRIVDVGPRRVVLVKRFDRTGSGPPFHPTVHFLSALSALDLDETSPAGSYPEIATFIRRFGSRHALDRTELFRRMVFNVLCGNRDDHLKNHALLRTESGRWVLSPAFDIVPQPDMDPLQAIGVGHSGGMPTISNVLSMAGDFGLDRPNAASIIQDICGTMRPWRRMFSEWNVPNETIRRLEWAFSRQLDDPAAIENPAP